MLNTRMKWLRVEFIRRNKELGISFYKVHGLNEYFYVTDYGNGDYSWDYGPGDAYSRRMSKKEVSKFWKTLAASPL